MQSFRCIVPKRSPKGDRKADPAPSLARFRARLRNIPYPKKPATRPLADAPRTPPWCAKYARSRERWQEFPGRRLGPIYSGSQSDAGWHRANPGRWSNLPPSHRANPVGHCGDPEGLPRNHDPGGGGSRSSSSELPPQFPARANASNHHAHRHEQRVRGRDEDEPEKRDEPDPDGFGRFDGVQYEVERAGGTGRRAGRELRRRSGPGRGRARAPSRSAKAPAGMLRDRRRARETRDEGDRDGEAGP